MKNKTFRQKFSAHISRKLIGGFVVGTVLFFLFAAPFVLSTEHLIERFTPQQSYFHYVDVKPVKPFFEKGETLRFYSFVEYYKDVDMKWQDTLFCYEGYGWKKYTPQFWPSDQETQRKSKGLVNLEIVEETGALVPKDGELEFWELFKHTPAESATHCYVCGSPIGVTEHGYEKYDNFCTETFPVNQ